MTDNEIIKALECCKRLICKDCPIFPNSTPVLLCKASLEIEALDLIKRQQAEIERLTGYNSNLVFANQDILHTLETEIAKAKSEAITEFAERLKRKSELVAPSVYATPYRAVRVEDIENLVKAMTEGDDGKQIRL